MPVKMNERERLCRALYLKCPQAWEQPAQDWQQIVDRYRRRGIHEITASMSFGNRSGHNGVQDFQRGYAGGGL